jgi:hypothetical protein
LVEDDAMTMNVFEKIEEGLKDALVIAEGDMTDTTKLRADIRAGLDGVTPGTWEMVPAGNRPEVYASTRQAWGHDLLCRVESLNPAKDAQHIARCSPDNIRALLDALDAAERERDEARAKALEEARAIVDHAMPADPSDGDADSVRICERIMDEIDQRIAALKDRAP